MRKITRFAAVAATLIAGGAQAESPNEVKYLIYIAGQYSGHSTSRFQESKGVLMIDTETVVDFFAFQQKSQSHTEVDAKTLTPLYFSWKGEKMEQAWAGTVAVEGKVFSGEVTLGSNVFPSKKTLDDPPYFFENYVTAHQVLIMTAVDQQDQPTKQVGLFLPSDYLPAKAVVSIVTEIEWQATKKPVYAKRFVWQMENSDPFYAVYDPDRRVALYLDYPATRTEVFLASDYPEKPITKYQLTEEERETMSQN